MPVDAAAHADLLGALSAEQRRAATAVTGPVCILAGAGSGKTRTITHRIAHQVASQVARSDQILAVTFTERAAAELRGRLCDLGITEPVRATTFHAAAWAQLRHFWGHQSERPLPAVLTSKARLLRPSARRLGIEPADLAAEIEWAKAHRLDAEAYAQHSASRLLPAPAAAIAEAYAAYERDKDTEGLLDYEDMLLVTTRLLAECPEVAAAVRDRYRFFTVDEFQDVNPAQWALLRAWLGERDELCVVGDDAQSIYGFTGASASHLTGFNRVFPAATVVHLRDNHRSSPQVCAAASALLAPTGRPPLRALAPAGPRPQLRAYADADAEVAGVTAAIGDLLSAGVAPGDVAVCARTNAMSEPFEASLRAAGIAHVVRGGGGLFAQREVRQALRVLQAAAERPPRRHGPPPPAGTTAAAPTPVGRLVEQVLRDRLGWHPRRMPPGAAAGERWRNLHALASLAGQLAAAQPSAGLADVVEALVRRGAGEPAAADAGGAVNLLTLHKAKGTEFDAVFLVGVEEGLVPISHSRDAGTVDEERRLLYVGMTRARRVLQLSWARQRPGPGGSTRTRRVSPFVTDLAAVCRR